MEIVTKVMEKSWKSHGNLLVKMCTNPVLYLNIFGYGEEGILLIQICSIITTFETNFTSQVSVIEIQQFGHGSADPIIS